MLGISNKVLLTRFGSMWVSEQRRTYPSPDPDIMNWTDVKLRLMLGYERVRCAVAQINRHLSLDLIYISRQKYDFKIKKEGCVSSDS